MADSMVAPDELAAAKQRYMRVALDAVRDALASDDALKVFASYEVAPIREFKRVFTGVMINPPTVWIMPGTTGIGEEGQTEDEAHAVTVKIGITGADPEALLEQALTYVLAASEALNAAEYPVTVRRVWVRMHDYSQVFRGGNGFASFPELGLQVDMTEVMR